MTGSAGGISPWTAGGRRLRGLAPVVMARAMFQTAPVLTVAFLTTCMLAAGLTAAFVYASGAVIGSIPAAVRAGNGSEPMRRVQLATVAMALLFLGQQLLGGLQDVLSSTLGRRMEGGLRERVFRALAKPPTLDHLDDPSIQGIITRATTVGTARYGIGAAMAFGVPAVNAVFVGLWMTILVAIFS